MKDRISQLMKHQGMSQKEFAKMLCVAEATVSGIYNGRTRPTNQIVSAIHECFPNVSIPWLMFGEGSMYIDDTSNTALPVKDAYDNNVHSDNGSVTNVNPTISQVAPIIKETIKYIDKPQRKITEIRVFFDDGTFETFSAN